VQADPGDAGAFLDLARIACLTGNREQGLALQEAGLAPERIIIEAHGDEASSSEPWDRHPLVITSLEWLSRSKQEAEQAAAAGWDLVVIDEAHHLRGERAYQVAQALAKRTWGLLLLTATPLQLDPAEYHALLRLVDPAPAATLAELRARLARLDAASPSEAGRRNRELHAPRLRDAIRHDALQLGCVLDEALRLPPSMVVRLRFGCHGSGAPFLAVPHGVVHSSALKRSPPPALPGRR